MIKQTFILLVGVAFCSSGCLCSEHKIDISQANKRVVLTSQDLENFKRLADAMAQDFCKIRKLQEDLIKDGNRSSWIGTNSYYLYQIDSTKYSSLLAPVKEKCTDELGLSESGQVQIVLKESMEMNCDTYNDSYIHILTSLCYKKSDLLSYGYIQEMYVDSAIDRNWKYFYFKSHTGH